MKQARTIINHLREKLHKQPPLTNLHLSILAHGDGLPLSGFYSDDRCSPEDFAEVLFDMSIVGYYVGFVESLSHDLDYTIGLWLELSERRKTNIDASVIQEVVKIAEKAIKHH
jgi:hypothetical protein